MCVFDKHLHIRYQSLLLLESTLISLQFSHLIVQFSVVFDVKLQAERLQDLLLRELLPFPLVLVRCAQASFAAFKECTSARLVFFTDFLRFTELFESLFRDLLLPLPGIATVR